MQYRSLGRSNILVSELGIGCEGLLGKSEKFVQDALDLMESYGATAIDLYSPNPEMRTNLGRAMEGRRGKFVLEAHLSTIWKNGQYKRTRQMDEIREGFEDQLTRLKTDTVEIGMIHYVDSMDDWQKIAQGPVLDYALSLKKTGVVRAVGLSSHNPKVALHAVESGVVDVLLFSVNPCYDLQPADDDVEQLWNREKYAGQLVNMDPDRQTLYEQCAQRGVGITVMKAFGGGDLLHADRSPAGVALSLWQCIQYALDRPAVATVFAGAHSLDELRDVLAFTEASGAEKEYASTLATFPRISWKGHCMYCGHCAPCPAGIDVAHVTKLLNLARARQMIPETVREHYAALEHKASACLACGSCNDRCPFDVAAMVNMAQAAALFEEIGLEQEA